MLVLVLLQILLVFMFAMMVAAVAMIRRRQERWVRKCSFVAMRGCACASAF